MSDNSPRTLHRVLGIRDAFAGTLSNLAPAEGLFIATPLVAAAMGTATPWAFLLGGVAILCAGSNLAQFATRIPSASGYVGFLARTAGHFGERAGTFAGTATALLTTLGGPITLSAVLVFFGSWVASALGLGGAWWLVIALGVCVLAAPPLLLGVSTSARTALLLFTVEVVGLLVFAAAVLARSGGAGITAPVLHVTGHQLAGSFAGLTFALAISGFVGWENAAAMAEEVRNPRRVVPLVTVGSIALVALLYLVVGWAVVGGYVHWQDGDSARGMAELAASANPFGDLAGHYLPWFSWGVVGVGAVSAAACLLAGFNSCARGTFAMARAGIFPASLARLSDRGVPARAAWVWLIATPACTVVPYLCGAHDPLTLSSYQAGIGTVPLIGVYGLLSAALPVFMLTQRREEFRMLPHLVVPVIGTLVIAYGVYGAVEPGQPAPANTFWIYILAIALVSVAAAAVIALRGRPRAAAVALGFAADESEGEVSEPARITVATTIKES